MSTDSLEDFMALAGDISDDDDTFFTCREDRNMTQSVNCTVNDTFCSTASTVFRDLDSIEEEEEDRRTLTHNETIDLCRTTSSSEVDVTSPVSTKENPYLVKKPLACDIDSDDVDFDLNASGKSIKTLLQQSKAEDDSLFSLPSDKSLHKIVPEKPPKMNKSILGIPKEKIAVAPSVYDSFFNLKLNVPKVSSLAFDSLTEGLKKIKLMQLHLNKEEKDAFVTMGVIITKGEVKKSTNGNEYLIWKLHDLKNCQDKPVKLLLFGDACKDYWKLQAGVVVALISPQFADQQNNLQSTDNLATLKVAKRSQVIELGHSSSFGYCKSTCQNGQKCTNFVNLDSSEYCVYHVMSAARKLSSRRGTFNNISAVQSKRSTLAPQLTQPYNLMLNKPLVRAGTSLLPTNLNSMGTMKSAMGQAVKPMEAKTVTKKEEKDQLKKIMTDRAALPGAKNLQCLEINRKGPEQKELKKDSGHSMSSFIRQQETEKKSLLTRTPTLGFGMRGGAVTLTNKGAKDAQNDAAKLRALSILKAKSGNDSGRGTKRSCTSSLDESLPKQRMKLGCISNKEEIEKLLKTKSLHDKEARNEESAAEDRYFDGMASKEKLESFTTDCREIKNVKVITCKKCNYTARHQSEYCMQQGHLVKKSTADKRFFKCGGCSRRTAAYGLLPTKPCESCESTDWQRVAMKDERKVTLDNEKLELRGEEQMLTSSKWIDYISPGKGDLVDYGNPARDSLRALLVLALFGLTFAACMLATILKSDWARSHITSYIALMGGGVFLATCLLDLLPEALESFQKAGVKVSFPVAEASVIGGLFMVLLVEQTVLHLKERGFFGQNHIEIHGHDHDHAEREGNPQEESKLGSILLVGALSLHALFEGLSLAVIGDASKLLEVFAALILHKCIIGFSLGVRLVQSGITTMYVAGLSLIFSIQVLVGGLGGLGIMEIISGGKASTAAVVASVLQGIACGTFLYITTFEVVPHELEKPGSRLKKVFFLFLGILIVIFFMLIFPESDE